jgi:uncharacterized hydrophobic protein (TIGR00271 family)
VLPASADRVLKLIEELAIPVEDYLLAREEVIAPDPLRHGPLREGFTWTEVLGHARAQSRPIGRYLALMLVAAVIAATGVIKSNSILIVGAMAVSPDLLPVCATCVGLVGRRYHLAWRAFGTLVIGLVLVMAGAAALTGMLDLSGLLESGFKIQQSSLSSLAEVDYSTLIIAAVAGVAAMLSFETRAGAAVGVAISVTTIPASAYFGVSIALGEPGRALEALLVLAINVSLLIVSGSLTVAVQRWLVARRFG